MNDDRSVDIQNIKQEDGLSEIMRHAFRVPIKDDGLVSVTINDRNYLVRDISHTGVSIAVGEYDDFVIAQVIKNCTLTIGELSIENLTGQIVHYSYDETIGWRNGIKWLQLDSAVSDKISAAVTKMKDDLLKDKDATP